MRNATDWTHVRIQVRTAEMTDAIISIWRVPPGHKSGFDRNAVRIRRRVTLLDLISAGVLHSGMELIPRRKQFNHRVATLLSDGRIEVDGTPYALPKDAASAIAGHRIGGWGFFFADAEVKRTLRTVRREYESALAGDVDTDDGEEDSDEEKAGAAVETA